MAEAMPCENFCDEELELFEIVRIGCGAALFGEGLLEGAALVHGGCGDDTAFVQRQLSVRRVYLGSASTFCNGLLMLSRVEVYRGPFYTVRA